jgi:hypothetical protein
VFMRLSQTTIDALASVITGGSVGPDELPTPYRTGRQLVNFFNEFGFRDDYGSDFPSRMSYTQKRLNGLNESGRIEEALKKAVDPRHFLDSHCYVEEAVEYLNRYLVYDGWQLVKVGKWYRPQSTSGGSIEVGGLFGESNDLNHLFIEEQLDKCDRKLEEGDFDGAITNARSLLEAVLIGMEEKLSAEPGPHDVDLPRLYKRVYRLMNLDPSRKDFSNPIREILSGLISTVSGLASLRNRMSDAHASGYRPHQHHATLAVNASKTVVRFLTDSLEYQIAQGLVSLGDPEGS